MTSSQEDVLVFPVALSSVGGIVALFVLLCGCFQQQWSLVYGGLGTFGVLGLFWLGFVVGRVK